MLERVRAVVRRLREWSRGPSDRCAECRGPALEVHRAEGFTFCSDACAGEWQAAEVAP